MDSLHQNQKEAHIFAKAIHNYISLLNSQIESFPLIMSTLSAKLDASMKQMEDFVKINNIEERENGDGSATLSLPLGLIKQYMEYVAEIEQSVRALQFIPKNIVVAFVSSYDAFLAELIEGIYKLCPDLLDTCTKEYTFVDILKFESIDDIKNHVIEKEVESILRENHSKQLDCIASKIKVELKKDLPCLDDFIEITERRNLFVHTDGKVSRQYISIVGDANKEIKLGDKLEAPPDYVEHCYSVLFEMGVKLCQVVWRKLDAKNSLEDAEDFLIDVIYNLLKNKKYDLSIVLSEFATASYVKDFSKAHEYIKCVNKALGYYLKGDKARCLNIVSNIDWSATELKYRLAAVVLEEKFEEAIFIMKSIGNDEGMQEAYCDWPLFSHFRETDSFKQVYKEVFGIDFNYIEKKSIKWEDILNEAAYINIDGMKF